MARSSYISLKLGVYVCLSRHDLIGVGALRRLHHDNFRRSQCNFTRRQHRFNTRRPRNRDVRSLSQLDSSIFFHDNTLFNRPHCAEVLKECQCSCIPLCHVPKQLWQWVAWSLTVAEQGTASFQNCGACRSRSPVDSGLFEPHNKAVLTNYTGSRTAKIHR